MRFLAPFGNRGEFPRPKDLSRLNVVDCVPVDNDTKLIQIAQELAEQGASMIKLFATELDWPGFERWLARIEAAPCVALDTETTSLDEQQARLVGISFAIAPGEAAYLPLAHDGPDTPDQLPFEETLARLKPWLENNTPQKILQHAKYDQHVFANHGIQLAGIVDDTLLAAYVLEAGQVSPGALELGTLARRHLGLPTIPYEAICGKGATQIGFNQVAVAEAAAYAAEDADISVAALTAKRLRVQVAATGDPSAKSFKLQYRKVGDGTWRDIN